MKDWLEGAFLEASEDDYDSCGNHEETRYYLKNGMYFRLDFQNGYPYSKGEDYIYPEGHPMAGKKGFRFIHGEYADPYPVRKYIRTVQETYFE